MRTLVLLSAAMMVVGVLLVIDRVAPQSSFDHEGGRSFPTALQNSQDGDQTNTPFARPEGRLDLGEHREGGEHAGGLGAFTLATLLKNLALMAVPVVLYWGYKRVKR